MRLQGCEVFWGFWGFFFVFWLTTISVVATTIDVIDQSGAGTRQSWAYGVAVPVQAAGLLTDVCWAYKE